MKINFSKENKVVKNEYRGGSYGLAKRHIAKWQWYLIVIIIISPLLYISYMIVSSQMDKTFSGFVYYRHIGISSPADIFIKKMNVELGAEVKKGDILFELESNEITVRSNALRKKLKYLKEQKKNIVTSHSAALQEMKVSIDKYLRDVSGFKDFQSKLLERGLSTIYNVQNSLLSQFGVLTTKLNMYYNSFYYDVAITDIECNIIDLLEELAIESFKISMFSVKAPIDGEIIKVNYHQHQYVSKDKEILLIADPNRVQIRAFMPPSLIDDGILLHRKVEVIFKMDVFLGRSERFEGVIISSVAFTKKDPGILISREDTAVLIIKMIDKLPEKYSVYGFPVKLKLK